MEKTVSYLSVDPGNVHVLPNGTYLKRRYQIQKLLGQGGFGITYLAWDHKMQTNIAIKEFFPQSIVGRNCTLSLEVCCNTQNLIPSFHSSKQRFLREAQALEKFRDISAIVGIEDYFEENNTAYIAMEYIAGVNLKDYITRKGGRLTVDETLRLLEPVFLALIHVHKSGLVHRDISPDNIMLSPQEGAKLLDFGAVRSVENPDVDKALSHSTEAILKHGFAPIEQYHSRGSLGPWTDEYALCGTIFYCLTGMVPDPVATRMSEDINPDWCSIAGLSQLQIAALEKGMSIKAKDRYPDIKMLYDALYRGMGNLKEKGDNDVVRSPNLRRIVYAIVAVVLAAALAVGLWVMRQNGAFEGANSGAHLGGEGSNGSGETDHPSDPTEKKKPPTVPTEQEKPTVPEQPSVPEQEAPSQEPAVPEPEEQSDAWRENVLVRDPLLRLDETKEIISRVMFLDYVEDVPSGAQDLTHGGRGKVWGWLKYENGYCTAYIAAEGGVNGRESCMNLFCDYVNLEEIVFGDAFHTDEATDMSYMFDTCEKLRYIDLSGFNTSNVTKMRQMFFECRALTSLDVSTFDTSKVTMMYEMFSRCRNVEELDLSNFDTSKVEHMGYMFSGCLRLKRVNVAGFDTSSVTNMERMFGYCDVLEDVQVRNWDVSNVTKYEDFMPQGKTVNGRPWIELFQ